MADYVDDGTFDWSLGQDAWHHPDRIQANQYHRGVNVSSRGGVLVPRPGYWRKDLDFDSQHLTTAFGVKRSIEEIWLSGKYQACIPYFENPEHYLITIVCGLIYRTNLRTLKTILLSTDIKVNQYAPRINWSYGAGTIVIFDFPAYPVLVQRDKVTRSDIHHMVNGVNQPQVPIANLGAYNQNRLFIANADTGFTAGDPVGDQLTPEAPITFTEIFMPSSAYVNQVFSLPTQDAVFPISAMGFIQELDANTGIGPMFVANETNIFFFRTNQPRSDWGKGQFGGLLLANVGIAGPRSFVNVNSDLVFVSADGAVHSFSTARNEMSHWGNVPISREVENYLRCNERDLMRYSVVGYFDNRILISANPYRMEAQDRDGRPVSDYASGGFVILDTSSMASLLTEATPIWSGLWTGVNPMDIVTIDGRCFVMSKDGCGVGGENAIYELKKDINYDTVKGRKRPIRSVIYSRLYSFKEDFAQKIEHNCLMHLQDLAGHVFVRVERKPTHSDTWTLWGTFEHVAPNEIYEMPADEDLNGLSFHQLKHLVFGDPDETGCSPLTDEAYDTFRAIQLRVTIEADSWVLEDLKIKARLVPFVERAEPTGCGTLRQVKIPAQCEPDWMIPEMDLCE